MPRTGCGSVWLERLVWDQEVAGSNPVTPITPIKYFFCRCSSMVEHQPSKLDTWVRFPSPAFLFAQYFQVFHGFFDPLQHVATTFSAEKLSPTELFSVGLLY